MPAAVSHPAFHRRIVIHGLEPKHVENFIRSYFPSQDNEDDADEDTPPALMQLLTARPRLVKLASNPLMCFLLCLVFQEEGGRLPESMADLFSILMRFVMTRSLQQKVLDSFFFSSFSLHSFEFPIRFKEERCRRKQ